MSNGKKELIKNEAIEDGAITQDKIATASITVDKLHPTAVSGVADNSIDTQHLKNNSVTNSKISPLTITSDKIASSTITGDKIASSTITGNKISLSTIDNNNIKDNTIQNDKLVDKTITYDKIADETITFGKLNSTTIQSLLDTVYKVGSYYIQFPNPIYNEISPFQLLSATFLNTQRPADLFGGAWEQVFHKEGCFFRGEGGHSNESRASNGVQPSALGTHRHLVFAIGNYNTSYVGPEYSVSTSSTEGGDTEYELDSLTTKDADGGRTGLPVEGVYSPNETRSTNILIKVWKRIA